METSRCFCGKSLSYEDCCEKYIHGKAFPSTPEDLMRSRYSAFVVGDLKYLIATMRDPAAKAFNPENTASWLKEVQWLGLTIINQKIKTSCLGYVSFEALYLFRGIHHIMREKSEFHKIGNRWFYIDGKPLNPKAKIIS